jgi:hypothetical protein
MNKYLHRYSLAALCLLAGSLRLGAQADLASLTGLVTDPSGATVHGAKVTAQSVTTGAARSTITDNSGYYTFSSLAIGKYTISVDGAGFNHSSSTIMLDPSQKARQDFQLQIGNTATSVQVNAAAPELSRDDASLGTVVETQVIQGTPLFERNWDDLIRLVPGVQQDRYTEQSGATAAGRTGDFTVNGVHSLQNDFILDGVDNNTFSENVQELTSEAARPSVDVLAEFKVITNPYSAEYGRSPGAAVDVSTAGGANQVHGSVFDFLRNRVFDANDYFSNQSGLPKPKNITNNFGGRIGAPIIHNKLFGFFDYEGTRTDRGITRIATAVPLDNERVGNFSPAAAQANGLVPYATIYNPTTNQPFPNNTIPTSMLDPKGLNLMSLFPQPNLPGEYNNYARTGSLTDNNDSYDGRVDWNPDEKNTVFVRYTGNNRDRIVPGDFAGVADGSSTSAWGNSTLKSYSAAIGWTHVFTPTLVNDLRLGFTRNTALDVQLPFNSPPPSTYVPGIPDNPSSGGGLPAIIYSNHVFLGSPDYLPKQQNPQQFQYVDTLSLTKGTHALKFGVDVRAPMRNIYQDEADVHGNVTFNGQFTCQHTANGQCASGTGIDYADSLIGYVQSATLANQYLVDERIQMYSGFIQDDWKVTPKLTLNLGLRYDFGTPELSGNNNLANFNPAGSGSLILASDGSLGDRALVNVNKTNFAPRFGFAYSPQQNTVIRGGYGIFNMMLERFGSEDQLSLNPPFLIQNTTSIASTSTNPVFLLQNGFPANYIDPANINYQISHIRATNPNSPTPTVQEWSFGVQQILPAHMVLDVNYVGSKSTHLDTLSDLNQYVNGVLPYPNFGYLEYQQALGNASFNALEISAKRRFVNGLALTAAYTWSKSIDNTPEELESGSGGAQNGYDQSSWRGLSDFDQPQRVSFSYVWELPFGKGKPFLSNGIGAAILGGWQTSGVYTFSSGRPFTMVSGSNYSNALDVYGAATAVPNVIGTPQTVGTVGCWVFESANPACLAANPTGADAFQEQALGQFGNAGRNTLRGPHTNVFDFSLMRNFHLYERATLQARWEVFNLANTPVFGEPSANLSTPSTVGAITTLASDPRIMQFALRLSF